jgi:hypothetical protein
MARLVEALLDYIRLTWRKSQQGSCKKGIYIGLLGTY